MFSYYLDLLNKPVYLLSESERLFIDIFPLLCIGIVSVIVYIIAVIIDVVKKQKRAQIITNSITDGYTIC